MGLFRTLGKMATGNKAGVGEDLAFKTMTNMRDRLTAEEWKFAVENFSPEMNAFIIGWLEMHFLLNKASSEVNLSWQVVFKRLGISAKLKHIEDEDIIPFYSLGMRHAQSAKKMIRRGGIDFPKDLSNLRGVLLGIHDIEDWVVLGLKEAFKSQ